MKKIIYLLFFGLFSLQADLPENQKCSPGLGCLKSLSFEEFCSQNLEFLSGRSDKDKKFCYYASLNLQKIEQEMEIEGFLSEFSLNLKGREKLLALQKLNFQIDGVEEGEILPEIYEISVGVVISLKENPFCKKEGLYQILSSLEDQNLKREYEEILNEKNQKLVALQKDWENFRNEIGEKLTPEQKQEIDEKIIKNMFKRN